MISYHKLAVLLSRFVAVLILLYLACLAVQLLVIPAFSSQRNVSYDVYSIIPGLIVPFVFGLLLLFGAEAVAYYVARGLDPEAPLRPPQHLTTRSGEPTPLPRR